MRHPRANTADQKWRAGFNISIFYFKLKCFEYYGQFSIISNCVYFYYAQNIENNMNVCPPGKVNFFC